MKWKDAGTFCTSWLGPRVYLVPSVMRPAPSLVMCLGLLLPHISATGAGTFLHYRGARGSLCP